MTNVGEFLHTFKSSDKLQLFMSHSLEIRLKFLDIIKMGSCIIIFDLAWSGTKVGLFLASNRGVRKDNCARKKGLSILLFMSFHRKLIECNIRRSAKGTPPNLDNNIVWSIPLSG